jgi:predicted lipoprotein with Yx(FWY)xxD motif
MHATRLALASGALALSLLAGCAAMGGKSASAAPAMSANGMLATPGGMTLYTFDKDTAGAGTSACTGGCAQLWPPFAAPAGAMAAGDYTLVTRDDGSKQWAYKGWPLYTYSKDAKSGDMAGDNFKNIWHVVKG